ncbi:MAG: hypothetical protein U0903_14830 [Planctomycetales bacterium]
MNSSATLEVELDFVEEMRLRTWARANYVPPEDRDENWHPVIHAEMQRRDVEIMEGEVSPRLDRKLH